MIARRAGVADGTIYLYFRDKEEILVCLFDRAMDRFVEEGRQLAGGGGRRAARLRRIIALHLNWSAGPRPGDRHQVELRHSLHFLDLFSRAAWAPYLAGDRRHHRRRGSASRPVPRRPRSTLLAKAIFGDPRRDGHRLGAVTPQHAPGGAGRSRGRLRHRRPASAPLNLPAPDLSFNGTRLVIPARAGAFRPPDPRCPQQGVKPPNCGPEQAKERCRAVSATSGRPRDPDSSRGGIDSFLGRDGAGRTFRPVAGPAAGRGCGPRPARRQDGHPRTPR